METLSLRQDEIYEEEQFIFDAVVRLEPDWRSASVHCMNLQNKAGFVRAWNCMKEAERQHFTILEDL